MLKANKIAEMKVSWSAAFTLANTMMGCALLSLGYAFTQIGWIIATIIFILCITFEYFAFVAIADCAHYGQNRTLRGMMQQIVGKTGAYILDFCIAFSNFGFLIVYISVFADYVQLFIIQVGGPVFKVIWIKLIVTPVLFAIAMLKSPDAISKSSAFAILFILVTVVVIVVYFFIFVVKKKYEINTEDGIKDFEFPGPKATMWPRNSGGLGVLDVFNNIPLFMPLFGAQATIPVLYADMQGPPNFRRRAMHKAALISLVMSGICYILVALFGSWMFGTHIRDNILMNFLPKEITMTVVRLLYALVVILSYMVIVYPVRATFMDWFKLDTTTKKGTLVFYFIGAIIVVISVTVSILVPSIAMVLNVISTVFGTVVYWCIPALALWIRPLMHANTNTPESDDEKDVENNASQIRRMSFSNMLLEQHADVIKDFANHNEITRPRTRSQIMQDERETRVRTKSMLVSKQIKHEELNSPRTTETENEASNSQSDIQPVKKRAFSISNARPTLANDILKEDNVAVQNPHLVDVAPQALSKEHEEVISEPEIQVAVETVETVDEKPHFALNDEQRATEMAKMTKCRLVLNWTVVAIFIAINIMGLVLTFVPYSNLASN